MLKKVPRLNACLFLATLRFCLITAQEDVALNLVKVNGIARLFEFGVWHAKIIAEY
jgi:hypothetical protein